MKNQRSSSLTLHKLCILLSCREAQSMVLFFLSTYCRLIHDQVSAREVQCLFGAQIGQHWFHSSTLLFEISVADCYWLAEIDVIFV